MRRENETIKRSGKEETRHHLGSTHFHNKQVLKTATAIRRGTESSAWAAERRRITKICVRGHVSCMEILAESVLWSADGD